MTVQKLEALREKAMEKEAKAAGEFLRTGNKRYLREQERQNEIIDLINLAMDALGKKEPEERAGNRCPTCGRRWE